MESRRSFLVNSKQMPLVLIFLLLFRFLSEWRLNAKFQVGQGVRLNYCLSSQPFYTEKEQVFYYQNHFQKLKIVTPLEPRLDFGDCLEIVGEITSCSESSRVNNCLLNPQILPFQDRFSPRFLSNSILKKLRNIRGKMAESFLTAIPSPESDLLSGIVLGSKQNLDPQFYDQLRSTGTLHIVVASGYNLSLVGEKPVGFLAYLLGRKLAIFSMIFLVWLYVGTVGFEPPVIRAAVMLSFLFLAKLLGRKFDQHRAFVFAVWLILMFKPDLVTSISFQLSVTALSGLFVGEVFFRKIAKIPVFGSDLASTLSAQLMVLPVIAWHFGTVSWLAPLSNLLILPLISAITGVGFISLFLFWWPTLGKIVLWGLYPLLWWSVFVVERLSSIFKPEFSLKINIWMVILYYLIIFSLFHKLSSKKGRAKGRQK